jgi:hypothetical protein
LARAGCLCRRPSVADPTGATLHCEPFDVEVVRVLDERHDIETIFANETE